MVMDECSSSYPGFEKAQSFHYIELDRGYANLSPVNITLPCPVI